MAQCDYCGKSKQFGRYIRHKHSIGWALRAQKKPKQFKPNVQKTRVLENGVMKKVHICTRCMRTRQKV